MVDEGIAPHMVNQIVPVGPLHLLGKCPLHNTGNHHERLFQQQLYCATLQYPRGESGQCLTNAHSAFFKRGPGISVLPDSDCILLLLFQE